MLRDLETSATCLRCGASYLANLISCPMCDAGGDMSDLPVLPERDWQSGVTEAVSGKRGKGFKKPRLFVRMPSKEGKK